MLFMMLAVACGGSTPQVALDTAPAVVATTPGGASTGTVGPSGDATTPTGTAGSGGDGSSTAWEGREGALVTRDCLFEDYAYAVDILLSCGSERFDEPLRLHTYKRHAHAHQKVFADQRLTYRDGQLWYDGYRPSRCIRVDAVGQLRLTTEASDCTALRLAPAGIGFRIEDTSRGTCAGLGDVSCDGHRWTGGVECGGIEHRYLPLQMGDCGEALAFDLLTRADGCSGEYPEDACF